jgi:hypothetical protein
LGFTILRPKQRRSASRITPRRGATEELKSVLKTMADSYGR